MSEDNGKIYISSINLTQQTDILNTLSGGSVAGREQNEIDVGLEGYGLIFETFLEVMSLRPMNLQQYSDPTHYNKWGNTRKVGMTLKHMNKWSLALFQFNNIRSDNVKNEIDEFRKIVRGCTASLACKECKQLTALARAMTITEQSDKEAREIFVGIHRG